MSILWISTGLGAILLSILGFLLCTAGIVALWMVKRRVEAVGNAAFAAADEAFAVVDAAMVRVKELFQSSRQRIGRLSRAAERVRDAEADARQASEPLLETLDAVFQELKTAQSWLEWGLAVAQGVSRVSEAAMSSKYAASHEDSLGVAITKRVREVSLSLAELIARLEVMRKELVDLRDSGKLAQEVVATGLAWAADLSGMLASIVGRLEKFDGRVAQAKTSVDALKRKLHWRIAFAAIALTVLLAWFGISQIGMIGHGWRLMHGNTSAARER